ncbi:uncharacterized protein [Apostichopus japonicus]|uniref:uncharacterized protein n=1 Tax=Stichopus japonicus TaxID=307972 RepID=UPI003AB6C72F
MTSLPKLKVPQETGISAIPILPQDCSPPRRSKTVIGLKKSSHSLDGNSRSAALFPWLQPDLPDSKPTPRFDPLRPTREKSFTLSSTDVEFENEINMLRKKREQYHQFHRNWMRPFYGSKVDQEEYRKGIRSELKNQMSEKQNNWKTFQKDKVQETVQAYSYDQECINKDRTDRKEKAIYLRKFRDENKKAIEERENLKRAKRINTAVFEQELLRYNPVNWSQTLR